MEFEFVRGLFLVLLAALVGGVGVRVLRLQPLVGYIIAGIIFGSISGIETGGVERLAEIGTILLLFSIGVELSFSRLGRVLKAAVSGATAQIILVALVSYLLLLSFGFGTIVSLVLSLGFSLSSTAVVVKILADRGETETIHGELMVGWLLVQDLAVIPIMVLLPVVAGISTDVLPALGKALLIAGFVVGATVFLGKTVAPYLIHKVTAANSRELLVIAAVALALGTAYVASLFGISPALGAFLAGVVIAETQEHHAIFAETRPLRDLFVALFFVTLGFLVSPGFVALNLGTILGLSAMVLVLKAVVILILTFVLGYHGKTAIATALGLAQIGEFSFIIYSFSRGLEIISPEIASIGIATTLVTLLLTPLFYKSIVPAWRKVRALTRKNKKVHRLFAGWDKMPSKKEEDYKDHIIVCGFGRVGRWVGKALLAADIPFVVVDYNQSVVHEVRAKGVPVVYGDPAEPEVLDSAGIGAAKAVVVAIPDRVSQEELIAYVQTNHSEVKIISRAHFDEDIDKLEILKVDKVVQPEFEAAIGIVRSIFRSMGKPKEEVKKRIANLRRSKAMTA
jgi:CPA2 family monovalent cation:H+ antiporter-2